LVAFEPYIVPFPEAGSRWRDISYWEDNPKNAPPAWINTFSAKKSAVTQVLDEPTLSEGRVGGTTVLEASFPYDYSADLPPSDLIFRAWAKGNVTLTLVLERPDNTNITLCRKSINAGPGKDIRIPLAAEAKGSAYNFISRYESRDNLAGVDRRTIKAMDAVFAKAQEGILRSPEPLQGAYNVKLTVVPSGAGGALEDPYLVVSGRVHGLLGTDGTKRDIWSGIVAGTKWALIIGLLTAVISVTVGVIYAVTSAYFGGWADSLMQRVYEVFYSLPMLPLLIVLSAVFKPNIWILIGIMCVLSWTGPVRVVRSMGLQLKEESFVEAARGLGASNARIIFKHIVPLLAPYAFASMALYVPSAIVAEASVSLLGLGDATICTWGQILHDAMRGGAVLQSLWWWVVPPGLAIALMGMTFAFIGFAMDTILHPKLRTR
jgi:peptide/nickel transport system permease protein